MRPGWKQRLIQVWPYATVVITTMFMVCALLGAFIAWQSGAKTTFGYIVAVVDPSLAAICLLLVCVVFPDVFLGKPFRIPHVFTLPALYLTLIFGSKTISQSSSSALRRFDGSDRFDLIWLRFPILIEAGFALVIVLCAIGALSKDKPDVK